MFIITQNKKSVINVINIEQIYIDKEYSSSSIILSADFVSGRSCQLGEFRHKEDAYTELIRIIDYNDNLKKIPDLISNYYQVSKDDGGTCI